jgi:dTDP-L-rhamnose 4-epimerase
VRVLVTGGAGFIGSRVVAHLLEGATDVRVLDRVDPAAFAGGPALDPRADVVIGDLCDPEAVGQAVGGVDAVCHQAAKVGLGVDFADVGSYVASNDVGTAVLLEALWRQGFSGRLVLASSMVVYGEGRARCADHGLVLPAPRVATDLEAGRFEPRCPLPGCFRPVEAVAVGEEAPPDPRNVYAATKLHQEHLCRLWGREAGASVVALRYHNVYGPGMPRDTPYAGVASIFRSALARGERPQVFEDGNQTRDFIHVDDVARANVLALGAGDVYEAYNVASGTPRTVLAMAAAMAGAVRRQAQGPGQDLEPVVTGQWRAGDVRHVVASPQRAAEHLGFTAEVSFEQGMAELATSRPAPASR